MGDRGDDALDREHQLRKPVSLAGVATRHGWICRQTYLPLRWIGSPKQLYSRPASGPLARLNPGGMLPDGNRLSWTIGCVDEQDPLRSCGARARPKTRRIVAPPRHASI